MGRLNRAQRIVTAIGIGFACYFLGTWAMTWGSRAPAGYLGWSGYAPLGRPLLVPNVGDVQPWTRLVILLALVVVWVVASAIVLRTRKDWRASQGLSRAVFVLGAGVALYLIGSWVSGWNSYCGWSGCPAPRRVATYFHLAYPPVQWRPWQLLLIWLGFACVWLTFALWSLRSGPAEVSRGSGPDGDGGRT